MKDKVVLSVLNSVAWLATISQNNEVMQTIQIILSSIATVLAIAYTVWKWYKNATSENSPGGKKITKEEFGNLANKVGEYLNGKEDDEQ